MDRYFTRPDDESRHRHRLLPAFVLDAYPDSSVKLKRAVAITQAIMLNMLAEKSRV
jgi:hypothetical protein